MKFELVPDEGTTGNFEVTLVETNDLVHSKKAGKGKCETDEERYAVISAIDAYLAKKFE